MHWRRWGVVAVCLLTLATACPPVGVLAAPPSQTRVVIDRLSPYWPEVVQQWEPLILQEAERRGLDPDLIAAVIWKESRGRQYAQGPVGAVGLMMVMPKEAGFTWRPTIAELQDAHTNLYWGSRALATVIRQSRGDLYSALAAYNGGWDQIHYRGPRRFATDIIDTYARAVAVRNGLSPDGHWVATVAALTGASPMTVVGPQRSLIRYSRPPVMADIPDCTTQGPPTAIAHVPHDGRDLNSRVAIWVLLDGQLVNRAYQRQVEASLDLDVTSSVPPIVWLPALPSLN